MTRKEIVKALRECSSGNMNCSKCPMWDAKIDLRCMDFAMKCAADMLEQDANTKSQLLPIPIEEITGTILVTPCWIEIKFVIFHPIWAFFVAFVDRTIPFARKASQRLYKLFAGHCDSSHFALLTVSSPGHSRQHRHVRL